MYYNFPKLKEEYVYTAGFEYLFPSLLNRIDMIKDHVDIKNIIARRKDNLEKLPLEVIVKEKTLKNFTLEFLDGVDINLNHFVENN